MSLLLVGNLLIFPHLMYDYVILLPAFLYSYKNIRFLNAKLSMIIIFYFWYGIRLFDYLKMYIYEVSIIIPNPTNVSYNKSIGRYELYVYRMLGMIISYSLSYLLRPSRILRTIKSFFSDNSTTVAEQKLKDLLRGSIVFQKTIKCLSTI